MEYDDAWFARVESTDVSVGCIGGVKDGCIVIRTMQVEVGHLWRGRTPSSTTKREVGVKHMVRDNKRQKLEK